MSEYDFKAALSSMTDASDWVEENYDTIQSALRLADKLQSGGISAGMVKVVDDKQPMSCDRTFKAMAEQLMKEVEE